MRRAGTVLAALVVLAGSALALSGCQTTIKSLNDFASAGWRLAAPAGDSAPFWSSAARKLNSAVKDISPEQEYYIGRAVGATIVSRYTPYDRPELNRYLNKLGQGLAQYSERPEIYAGYRFLALDTMEVNAFATPGGHVMVTRGLLSCARSEDELAAILAHEIAHIGCGHGLKSIRSARFTQAVSRLALEVGSQSLQDGARFSEAFGDSIEDITTTMVVSGYSQITEYEADAKARDILAAAGYDPGALESVLTTMKGVVQPGDPGFGGTHPSPDLRIASLRKSAKPGTKAGAAILPSVRSARAVRFAAAIWYI